MFKIVGKYRKTLMAIFAVGLMIAFTASFGNTPGGSRRNPVVGKLGGEDVHVLDLQNARHAWELLTRTPINLGNGRSIPAVYRLAAQSTSAFGVPIPLTLIGKDPEVFYALIAEADKLGLTASPDEVNELMANVDPSVQITRDVEDDYRYAFAALLKVDAAYQRALSAVKLSAPQRKHDAAVIGQELKVRYVEYNADEFKASVPVPTPEQLLKQFETFANSAPDQPVDGTNPAGFGYRYPNRVKVEFITVLREQLRDVVRKSKSAQDWEIEARKHYIRNRSQYPTSRPTDSPELSKFVKAPTTGPTTRPLEFEDYQAEIMTEQVDAEAALLADNVRRRIISTMEADYAAYRAAVGPATTRPATRPTGPATTLGVPYGSDQYLQALAQRIQSEFKFLPVVMALNKDFQSQKELSALPSIGQAHLPSRDMYSMGMGFAEFATTHLDAFGHTPGPRDRAPTLSVMQPSPQLTDEQENLHFFRITAADPAHAATEMAPFAKQVEADWRTAEAMKLAKAEAQKLIEPAKSDGLEAAVKPTGRRIRTSGTITSRSVDSTGDLKLKPDSQQALARAAYDLLEHPDAVQANRTAAVVELPRDGKVLVISLAEIVPSIPGVPAYQTEGVFSRDNRLMLEFQFTQQWFDPAAIEKRTGLVLDHKKDKSDDVEG